MKYYIIVRYGRQWAIYCRSIRAYAAIGSKKRIEALYKQLSIIDSGAIV